VNTKRPVRATSVGDTSRALSDERQRRFIQVHEAKFKKFREVALLTIQSGSFGSRNTVKSGAEPQPKIADSPKAPWLQSSVKSAESAVYPLLFGFWVKRYGPGEKNSWLSCIACNLSGSRNPHNLLISRILNIYKKSLCVFACNQTIIHPSRICVSYSSLDASDCSLFRYFQRYESSFFEPPVW
jgi:hypothetical protein